MKVTSIPTAKMPQGVEPDRKGMGKEEKEERMQNVGTMRVGKDYQLLCVPPPSPGLYIAQHDDSTDTPTQLGGHSAVQGCHGGICSVDMSITTTADSAKETRTEKKKKEKADSE